MAIDLIATTAGALSLLTDAYNWQQTYLTGVWLVCLFSNNHTVTDATVLSDLTLATFPGFSPAVPTWSTPALASGIPTSTSSTCTFTQTSAWPSTSYGIFVIDNAGTELKGAANFPTALVLTNTSPSYSTIVSMTMKSEF